MGIALSDLISSSANPNLARVRGLLTRKDRRVAEQAYVVEGRRAVEDALAAGIRPELVLVRSGNETLVPEEMPRRVPVRSVLAKCFNALSEVTHPQGILAVVPMTRREIDPTATPLVVVLDRVRDPGNMGTLLRAAAAAGATAVVLTPESVDPFNPKVVRAAMGAHQRIPIRELPDPEAIELLRGAKIVATTRADANVDYDAVDWRVPAAIVVGSEAEGVSEEMSALATTAIAIPMLAGVESLNAASAGAVVLFEAARQRRIGG